MIKRLSPSVVVLTLALALGCAHAPAEAPPAAAPAVAASLAAASTASSSPTAGGAPASAAPWFEGAVFYEVFVRSFKDSDGDGVGDLNGLIEKLDTLNDGDPATTTDLGVDALWLMPIFESPSYHGYDTTDYETIAKAYGTNADFQRLLAEAHRRGIKVIVDLVLNHTAVKHPWFIDSASSKASPKRDWYVWSKTDPGWGQPWNASSRSWHPLNGEYYYGLFWKGMPDLNFKNPAVRAEMTRIASAWVKAGVDGFRLDAVRHLVETGPGAGQAGSPENHVVLKELAKTLHAINPRTAMVGEVWSTTPDIAEYFGQGDELEMLFDFPLAGALVKSAWAGDSGPVVEVLADIARAYPKGAVDAPFLTNHDQARVATALARDPQRLKLAAAMLLTLPGAPFVYYGEELGLPNGPGGEDEWKRTPMLWTDAGPGYGFTTGKPWHATAPEQVVPSYAAQVKDPGSLWSRYQRLIAARHASAALLHGGLEVLTPPGKVLAFVRQAGAERALVVHNLASSPQTVPLLARSRVAEPLFVDPGVQAASTGAGWAVTLPPYASGVFRLKD
jgi:alpha-amylase